MSTTRTTDVIPGPQQPWYMSAERRTPPTVAFLMGALVTVTAIQVGAVIRAVPTHEHRAATTSSQPSESAAYPRLDLRRD